MKWSTFSQGWYTMFFWGIFCSKAIQKSLREYLAIDSSLLSGWNSSITTKIKGWYGLFLDEYANIWMNKWLFIHILDVSSILMDVRRSISEDHFVHCPKEMKEKNPGGIKLHWAWASKV
jgi:hypothetical protein